MDFNAAPSSVMHIDINSCFATIEQQANPFLRNKPVAVAAYATKNGCILAASYPAKYLGVKTGMRVKDAQSLCPNIIVLSPDPAKYRFVHKKLRKILEKYSTSVHPKSIDEFVINFSPKHSYFRNNLQEAGLEIKDKIKKEIGDYITVSIGISTNRFLAKTAANYKKPDGLFEVNKDNYLDVFASLKLTDLCGIKTANAARLNSVGIYSCLDFFASEIPNLKAGFHSINGYYWYMRLHGYEIDDISSERKSFGNQYALPKPFDNVKDLSPILTKLTEKMAKRLREKNYMSQGVHLGILFKDHTYWHKSMKLVTPIFASTDFTRVFFHILKTCLPLEASGRSGVKLLSVACFNLQKKNFLQLDLASDVLKKESLAKALDDINDKFGKFTITPARIINNENYVLDRIAFGVID